MSLSIDEINNLITELEAVKQQLITAQAQYNKVVEQNKAFQKEINDLKEMYCIG